MKKNYHALMLNHGEPVYKGRSLGQETWHRLLKDRGAVIGMIFLVALVAATILAGFIWDYEADVISISRDIYQPPSASHFFGTDQMGRDIFVRVLYGARYSLAISFSSVAFGVIIGVILGSLAGFYGGAIDLIVMRYNDP